MLAPHIYKFICNKINTLLYIYAACSQQLKVHTRVITQYLHSMIKAIVYSIGGYE